MSTGLFASALLVSSLPLISGVQLVLNGSKVAATLGVPVVSHQRDAEVYLAWMGVRGIAFALVKIMLLVTGQRRAAGYALAANALVPLLDTLLVFRHHRGLPDDPTSAIVGLTLGLLVFPTISWLLLHPAKAKAP